MRFRRVIEKMLEVVSWKEKVKEMETALEELIAFKKRVPVIIIGEYFKNYHDVPKK